MSITLASLWLSSSAGKTLQALQHGCLHLGTLHEDEHGMMQGKWPNHRWQQDPYSKVWNSMAVKEG